MEERKPQLVMITDKAETLMRRTDQYDSERIHKQVLSMSSQWEAVCKLLSSLIQSTPDILSSYTQFNQLHESLCEWMATVESSVSRELEESFLSSPDDQGDTVFQVGCFFFFVSE